MCGRTKPAGVGESHRRKEGGSHTGYVVPRFIYNNNDNDSINIDNNSKKNNNDDNTQQL